MQSATLLAWPWVGAAAPPDLPRGERVAIELADARREVLEFRARPPAWSRSVLNAIFGAGRGARERREGWLAEHWVDVHAVDRSGDYALHDWLAHRGIPAEAQGRNEYQETIHFVEPGSLEWFSRNGIARGPRGERVLDPRHNVGVESWARRSDWNAWIATNSDPRWAAVIDHDQSTSPLVGDAISQDNIGGATARIGRGAAGRFGDFDQLRFAAWLRAAGRSDPLGGLTMRRWIARHRAGEFDALVAGRRDPELLHRLALDPALSDYHLAQHVSQLQALVRHYRNARRVAERVGRDFDFHGNLGGGFVGMVPYAVAAGDVVDTIWFESSGWSEYDLVDRDLHNAWGPFRFQLADAIAGPARTYTAMSRSRRGTPDLVELEWAEASAGGAVLLAQSSRHAAKPELLRRLGDLMRMRERHRAVYEREGRRRHARVGLVYSLPSHLYAQFVPHFNQPVVNDLAGAARAMDEGHVPYQVLIFSHPELRPERKRAADLAPYAALILPSVECVSEAQLRALEAYLRGGGTVLVLGRFGVRDEFNRPRRGSALARLEAAGRVLRPLGRTSYPSSRSPDDARAKRRARRVIEALRAVADAAPIARGLPPKLWVRAFVHRDGLFSAHFVNHDFERESGRVRPSDPGPFDVEVPRGIDAEQATWLVPGEPPRSLPLTVSAGRARVDLPAIGVHGVLAIGASGREATWSALRRGDHLLARVRRASGDHPVPPALGALADARDVADAERYVEHAERLLRLTALRRDHAFVRRLAAMTEARDARASFDFGKGRAPRRGAFRGVEPDTHYEKARGYGWLPSRDRSGPTPEERWYRGPHREVEHAQEIRAGWLPAWPYDDELPPQLHAYVYSARAQRFRVDLPDGDYRVRVVSVGGPAPNLRVSGAVWESGAARLFDLPLRKGALRERSFVARARDGALQFEFGAASGFALALLHIEAASAGAAGRATALEAGALRDWRISPRHPNPDWVPFADLRVPAAGLVSGAATAGSAPWSEVRAPPSGIAVVDLGTVDRAAPGDIVYAATRLPARERPATLLVGATSSARVWLDGRLAADLPNVKGLERAEARVALPAGPGAALVVELMRFWERRWLFHASVVPGREVAHRLPERDN